MNEYSQKSKYINLFFILITIISILVILLEDRLVQSASTLGFILFTLLFIGIAIVNRNSRIKLLATIICFTIVVILNYTNFF